MLNCDSAAPWLSSYLDGNLPSPIAEQLESHLLTCSHCAHDLFSQRLVLDRLREPDASAIPSDSLRSRIMRALQSDNPHCTPVPAGDTRVDYQLPFPLEH